jgi:hypothetical protein
MVRRASGDRLPAARTVDTAAHGRVINSGRLIRRRRISRQRHESFRREVHSRGHAVAWRAAGCPKCSQDNAKEIAPNAANWIVPERGFKLAPGHIHDPHVLGSRTERLDNQLGAFARGIGSGHVQSKVLACREAYGRSGHIKEKRR